MLRFLGLASYYRQFILQFASIVALLTKLLTKDSLQHVHWTAECKEVFQTLKTHLCQERVLYSPDFVRGFTIQTDASEVGFGAVLSQEINGEEHPILYISQKLFFHEKNYSVIEKEAITGKRAVDALWHYLLGNPFVLVTDHAPMKWLNTMKETNARLMH